MDLNLIWQIPLWSIFIIIKSIFGILRFYQNGVVFVEPVLAENTYNSLINLYNFLRYFILGLTLVFFICAGFWNHSRDLFAAGYALRLVTMILGLRYFG
jgi:hypothetical protein